MKRILFLLAAAALMSCYACQSKTDTETPDNGQKEENIVYVKDGWPSVTWNFDNAEGWEYTHQDDAHELDFEIGYGKAYARQSCNAAEDELVACLTNQQNPYNSTYVPIKPGWHVVTIRMDVDSNNYYKASWVIDGETVKTLPLNFGPDKYSNFLVACSVENLTFLGDHMPTQDHTAQFDWVTVEIPE